MLYFAELSYDSKTFGPDKRDAHGKFSALLEADNVKAALAKLKRLIRTRQAESLYSEAGDVFLDVLVQIENLPKGGLMPFMTLTSGEPPGGLVGILPFQERGCAAFCDEPEGGAPEVGTFTRPVFIKLTPIPEEQEPESLARAKRIEREG